MNEIKTLFLLSSLTLLMIFVGQMAGGYEGMLIAFAIAVATNFFAYFFSSQMALNAYNATQLSYEDSPWLHDTIAELAHNAGIPKPKIYIAQMGVPNAFATGRNPQNAAIAVTPEIMELLNAEELRGVLAHEMAHIKNSDILISSIAATLAGAISMLINFMGMFAHSRNSRVNPIVTILLAILAPLAAMIIQMAISRSREFLADEEGAKIAKDPNGLADALLAISGNIDRNLEQGYESQAKPNTAHMMIINPLGGWMRSLFSTHPSTQERVARLRSMSIVSR